MIRSAPPVRYVETPPSTDLTPYVQCFWELEGGADALAEPIFPDGRVEIVVHLGDRPVIADSSTTQPDVMVVGQMTAALRLRPSRCLHAIGVRFTPTGARAWLAAPVHEITDRIHSVDDVRRGTSRRFQDVVREGLTWRQRIGRIERVLRATLRTELRSPRSIECAVGLTLARKGHLTIDALADACGIGVRQLERQYLDVVGLTPKVFARTVRFQRALHGLRLRAPAASVAAACGFADQPHLAREFRRFAGTAARDVNLANVAFLQDGVAPAVAD